MSEDAHRLEAREQRPESRARRLNDFSWTDGAGGLHFDLPALLRELKVADTAENRAVLGKMIRRFVEKEFPATRIVER